jgi:hypothetical protein
MLCGNWQALSDAYGKTVQSSDNSPLDTVFQ